LETTGKLVLYDTFNQCREIDFLAYKSSGLFCLCTTARDDQCSRSIYFIPMTLQVPLTVNLKVNLQNTANYHHWNSK